ncbi:EI24 domain-containing protein [Sphingomonas nostoxanthinifaciens]|uniref:EI24 domain-containing protein n=1 Tax=Sphingomonas nostoxanthinifaciens TaxID=2872652 RepID=UPI001CC1DCCC|nr:EI24 domain-containing protein [Sphingomonas nostoxanthinifaciens]UAK23443.1 EI24 domain-containing protein [Sphingomonas nostoxanthinifaciens]
MLRALSLGIADLADPRILGVLVRSLLVTLLVFAGLGLVIAWALTGANPCGWLFDDTCVLGLSASGLGALMLTVLGIWFLFPAVALGVIAAYMDRIVGIVEAKHYPEAAAAARPLGWGRGALLGLRSSLRIILYNLVALPFYILLLVTGIGTLVLFVLVNGVAFGRDLGEMVAARHDDRTHRQLWLANTRGERSLLGGIVTGLFLIPIVNLIAPILGATAAAHLFHGRPRPTIVSASTIDPLQPD